jgi:hypothetical protein
MTGESLTLTRPNRDAGAPAPFCGFATNDQPAEVYRNSGGGNP